MAWSLDPSEVSSSTEGLMLGGRTKASQSRALDRTGRTITLEHPPTGLRVSGSVPLGRYTKAELRRRMAALHAELFASLESAVAKALRVPGR